MEKKRPLVSVIIACFNAEPYIDSCLESLVAQTYDNLEIVICDDASTDESYKKLLNWKEKDNRITLIRNQTNSYAAASRNNCIAFCHGDYIMLQDIDDVSAKNRVEILLQEFEKSPEIAIISSAVYWFKTSPKEIIKIRMTRPKYPTKWSMVKGMALSHPASMIKKEAIDAVCGYRVAEETRRCQDYDMFMQMYAKGFRGKNIDTPLYFYRVDEANYKRRTFKARVGEFKIRLRGYRAMGMLPWAYPFAFIPFVAYIKQSFYNMFAKE